MFTCSSSSRSCSGSSGTQFKPPLPRPGPVRPRNSSEKDRRKEKRGKEDRTRREQSGGRGTSGGPPSPPATPKTNKVRACEAPSVLHPHHLLLLRGLQDANPSQYSSTGRGFFDQPESLRQPSRPQQWTPSVPPLERRQQRQDRRANGEGGWDGLKWGWGGGVEVMIQSHPHPDSETLTGVGNNHLTNEAAEPRHS